METRSTRDRDGQAADVAVVVVVSQFIQQLADFVVVRLVARPHSGSDRGTALGVARG
jgi:hypothetical protein